MGGGNFILIKHVLWQERKHECALCKKALEYKQAQVHHVLPYHRFPDLATKRNNMIFVCNDCHREIHYRNPFLNIHLMREKAREFGLNLKDYYNTYDYDAKT